MQQIDQVTQRNTVLVEEMAAAASSLRSQAKALVDAMAFFHLSRSTLTELAPGLNQETCCIFKITG